MRSVLVYFLALFILSGCSRGLTTNEIAFLGKSHGNNVDFSKIKIQKGGLPNILPRASAVTVRNKIFWSSKTYRNDFNPPNNVAFVEDLMLLAHEITHVWQFQHKELTGYNISKVIAEHTKFGKRVYDYPIPINPNRDFLSYRYEQQGQIVQDWVCLSSFQLPDASIYGRIISQHIPLKNFASVVKLRNGEEILLEITGRKRRFKMQAFDRCPISLF